MDQPDFIYYSLAEISRLLEQREISPVEICKAMIERIERFDPKINSFITRTFESALQHARDAEILQSKNETPGALTGIPVALKDLYDTQGIPTTAGSPLFRNNIPEQDATVVHRLKDAGAVILGKLNMHEIALGITNINPHFGDCRNPWDTNRVPGGSSGGSAAALAAGFCYGSLGSDTGGSIRIPSALCGVAGLKPTRGRVSLHGVIPLSWNMDHAGPMARNVEDLAILLQIIAGYDPADPGSMDVPVPDYSRNLANGVKGWKVILASDEYFDQADAEIQNAVNAAADIFLHLGARVETRPFSNAELAFNTNIKMLLADAAAFHAERINSHPQDFGDDVLTRLMTGVRTSAPEYSIARRTQQFLIRTFEEFFRDCDVLLTPATPVVAPLIEGQDSANQAPVLTRFTSMFNLTGLPAASIPCGFSRSGMPIGLQLAARPWDEARLLQAAYAYQQAAGWHNHHPDLSKLKAV